MANKKIPVHGMQLQEIGTNIFGSDFFLWLSARPARTIENSRISLIIFGGIVELYFFFDFDVFVFSRPECEVQITIAFREMQCLC